MDKIKVSGIEFFAYHGVLESEKQLGQMFSVDCEFSLGTSICNDNLDNTVNYGELSAEIVAFCQRKQYNLLETLANELTRHLLIKYRLIEKISLTVHKPHAPITVKFSDVTLTITRGWKTCYLGIGSNLGNKQKNLDMVTKAIAEDICLEEIAKSAYIETEPYGVTDQPKFLNGVIKIKTIYTPLELLAFCKQLEKLAGREKTRHWGERTLDVDILMYSDEVIFTQNLIVPHPEMHLREFVLIPLKEIDPYLVHPIKKTDIKTMLDEITKKAAESIH